jgi:hypothetical protein
MANYILPTFNLLVNVWTAGTAPPAAPRTTCMGNLAFGRRTGPVLPGVASSLMQLLVPAGTDIRDGVNGPPGRDLLEVPAGTGRYYQVNVVDDLGKGFANEHRVVLCSKFQGFGNWPIPIP